MPQSLRAFVLDGENQNAFATPSGEKNYVYTGVRRREMLSDPEAGRQARRLVPGEEWSLIMKMCISASSALLATAMMVTLSFGCGEGVEGETGSQSAELSKGQCNAIIARSLGTAQECFRSGCGVTSQECDEVRGVFGAFFGNDDCAAAFAAGDLNGLPGNASVDSDTGEGKHVGGVICSAVVQCDFCAVAVPSGICADQCQ